MDRTSAFMYFASVAARLAERAERARRKVGRPPLPDMHQRQAVSRWESEGGRQATPPAL